MSCFTGPDPVRFALLDVVTRAEASVSGRLAQLEAQDRAFQLLTLDLANATHMQLNEVLDVQVGGRLITWQASGTGHVRVLTDANGQVLQQSILDDTAILSNHGPGVISLKLPEPDIWRLIPVAALPLE